MNFNKKLLFGALAMTLMFASCANEESAETTAETNESTATEEMAEPATESKNFQIDPSVSKIKWKGEIAGIKDHYGFLDVKKGSFYLTDGELVGGTFEVDMTTIAPTDENYDEKSTSEMLVGHLESADFFDVASHPTASMKIGKMKNGELEAELTIRGVTKPVKVMNVGNEWHQGKMKLFGDFVFDRQEFGVAYQNAGKDFLINDEVQISVSVTSL